MVKEIIEEKRVSIPEVKEILDQVAVKLENYEHLKSDPFFEATWLYANNFSKMDASAARKIIKMLKKEYNMDDSHAIQIVNINPSFPEEVRVILEKDPVLRELSDDDLTILIQKIKELQA